MHRTFIFKTNISWAATQGDTPMQQTTHPPARWAARPARAMRRNVLAASALALTLSFAPLASQAAAGGAGIESTGGANVLVCSTVSGGLDSDGSTRAPSVRFGGGGNTLTLQVGYRFPDGVTAGAGDTLALGGVSTTSCLGSVNGSFDVGAIGGSGTFQGFDALAKTGPSTWTLTGSNPATSWAVQAGTLKVDGAIGGARATGGTLGGSGNAGAIQLVSGGVVAPGDSPGTLQGTDMSWDGGGVFQFELGSDAAGSDLLALSGVLSKGAGSGFVFHFADGTGAPVARSYRLITFASQSGFAVSDFSYNYSGSAGGLQGRFELSAGALDFVVTGVGPVAIAPIPTLGETALALLAALLAVSGWAWGRRQQGR